MHRLVRISPFDSSARRHTSFAQVDVGPLVDEGVEVELDDADLRVDTYRASGAGGQHVNKTDSAVRITHVPTGLVVQCQNERSQTQNKAVAMQLLRSKLIELEERKRAEELAKVRGEVKEVAWGSQIRSYFLHPDQRVKDHRTGHESGDTQGVLDGDIDDFIRDYLNKTAAPATDKASSWPGSGRADLGRARLRRSAEGLLVLHHGRGTDERDLLGLADALDPGRRLQVVTPRAPLRLPGSPGYHWYLVPRVGYPDRDTLPRRPRGARRAARRALGGDRDRARADRVRRLLDGSGDELRDGALGADRPAVAGILAFSGFIPIVEDWRPSFEDRRGAAAFVAHGRNDPIIEVGFAAAPASCSRRAASRSPTASPRSATRSTRPTSLPRPSGCRGSPELPKIESDWNQTTWLWTVRRIVRCLGVVAAAVARRLGNVHQHGEAPGGAHLVHLAFGEVLVDCGAGRSWRSADARSPASATPCRRSADSRHRRRRGRRPCNGCTSLILFCEGCR